MIQVESGVPVEPIRRPRREYPFEYLQVDDSFFVAGRKPHQVSGSCVYWRRKFPGRKFVTRSVEGGTRVWRTA